MKRENVLTEEEKKLRFKKQIEKKDKESTELTVEAIQIKNESLYESGYSSSDSVSSRNHLESKELDFISPTLIEPTSNGLTFIVKSHLINEQIQTRFEQIYSQTKEERLFRMKKLQELEIFSHYLKFKPTKEDNVACSQESRPDILDLSIKATISNSTYSGLDYRDINCSQSLDEYNASSSQIFMKTYTEEKNSDQLIDEYIHKKFG